MRLKLGLKRQLGRLLNRKRRGRAMQAVPLETVVELIFQAALARRPDPGGMATYTAAIGSGAMLPTDVLTDVRSSHEGHRARTLDCTSLVVPALYEALMERSPTPDEVNHWRAHAAATGGIGEVVRGILALPEASRAQFANGSRHQGLQELFLAEYRRTGVIDG